MASWMGLFKSRIAGQSFMQRYQPSSSAEAMRQANRAVDDPRTDVNVCTDAMEALFRLQLLFGSEQAAEDLVTDLNRRYVRHHRREARWLMAINGAILELHRFRPARAAELMRPFLISDSPSELRAEATILLAYACTQIGEITKTERLIDSLEELMVCGSGEERLIEAVRVDLCGTQKTCPDATLDFADLDTHLNWRRALRDPDISPTKLHGLFSSHQQMCSKSGARAWSEMARIHGASRLIELSAQHLAEPILRPLIDNGSQFRVHPMRDELLHCRARLLAHQGRYAQAFQCLSEYVEAHQERLRKNTFALPKIAGESRVLGSYGEAIAARLPPKYRRIIPLVQQRISDAKFGVQDMAACINVTERAIQLTFKERLGMSPAQLIRHMRQHGMSEESAMVMEGDSLVPSGQRWGFGSEAQVRGAVRAMASHLS